jgi:hypothetical protein
VLFLSLTCKCKLAVINSQVLCQPVAYILYGEYLGIISLSSRNWGGGNNSYLNRDIFLGNLKWWH